MAEILKVDPVNPESEKIARVAVLIREGKVIAIPTDTVYGLAADPLHSAAVERIFAIKRRPPDAPVLVLVDSAEMAVSLAANVPSSFQALAKRFWPGPLTIVVEASNEIPEIVTANTGRLGMRLPKAPIARALIQAVGGPVTATSANLSGEKECRSAAEVEANLGEELPLILDGGASGPGLPSTVVSLDGSGWRIIREGAVGRAELAAFFAGG